jgi:hypothetical protein
VQTPTSRLQLVLTEAGQDKDPEILCVLVVDTAEAWDNIAGFRIIIIIIMTMIIMTMITRRPVFPISGEASLP